jgi:hypothetical protein
MTTHPAFTKTLVGTNITQYGMDAKTALEIGLLTDGAEGCAWFADWARQSPTDEVNLYTFGGFIGGFIYGEPADFTTLAEFAHCADDAATTVWVDYLCMVDAWLDR